MKEVLLCFPGERYKWALGGEAADRGGCPEGRRRQKGEQDITATPMPPKAEDETTIAMEIGIYFANEIALNEKIDSLC